MIFSESTRTHNKLATALLQVLRKQRSIVEDNLVFSQQNLIDEFESYNADPELKAQNQERYNMMQYYLHDCARRMSYVDEHLYDKAEDALAFVMNNLELLFQAAKNVPSFEEFQEMVANSKEENAQ
jgi:hypothetical protein